MQRLEVRYQKSAIDDLDNIFSIVMHGSASVLIAIGFIERIRARCQRIGNAPHGGRPRDDLEPGLRTVPFEHTAIIAYRVDSDCVRVTNVFYGGRDYEALYHSSEGD